MEKAYDYAIKDKYDVGIYGVWFGANYGSVATYYALHEIIRSFGLSVLMIDMPAAKTEPASLTPMREDLQRHITMRARDTH